MINIGNDNMVTNNRKYFYLWNYDSEDLNSNGQFAIFNHDKLEESCWVACDNDQQPEVTKLTI